MTVRVAIGSVIAVLVAGGGLSCKRISGNRL